MFENTTHASNITEKNIKILKNYSELGNLKEFNEDENKIFKSPRYGTLKKEINHNYLREKKISSNDKKLFDIEKEIYSEKKDKNEEFNNKIANPRKNSIPENIEFLTDLIKENLYCDCCLDNIFTIFNSIDNIYYLIYYDKYK